MHTHTPFVLALESDHRQASILKRVIRDRVHAELMVVDSRDAAIAATSTRVPDVILLTALLSPRDEQELIAHLRGLAGAEHVQTHTIPQLASSGQYGEPGQESGGLFGKLRRKKNVEPIPGCDPAAFADEVGTFIARAAEMKAHVALVPPPIIEQPRRDDTSLYGHAETAASAPASHEEPVADTGSAWASPFEWRRPDPAAQKKKEPAPRAPLVTNAPLAVVAEEEETRRTEADRRAREEAERERAHLEAEDAAKRQQDLEQAARRDRERAETEAVAQRERERLEAEQRATEEAARRAGEEAATRERERAEAERRAREDAERRAKEEVARRAHEEAERRAKEDAATRERERLEAERRAKEAERRATEEAARRAHEEAERRAKEDAARRERERLEAERRAKQEAAIRERERVEAEHRAKEEAERRAKEEAARRAKEEAERRAREEAARRAKEEAERRAKEEAERRAKEEADRRAREEAARRERERLEAEQRARQEAERLEAEAAAARERLRLEAEAAEQERLRAEAEERARAEAEDEIEIDLDHDAFSDFRLDGEPESALLKLMPVTAWARTDDRKRQPSIDGDPKDEFHQLITGLSIPPHVAAVAYARGCRIRRVRVPAPRPATRGRIARPVILSKRALAEARNDQQSEV